jgi:hypothetical protein
MNPILKALASFSQSFDLLIGGVNKRILDAIQAGFFFIIFILAIVGGFIGYRSGIESAEIKSPPIIDTTNDVFEIDLKKEKGLGDFSTMLDSRLITEGKVRDRDKIRYPSQEGMELEPQGGILEPEETAKARVLPDVDSRPGLLEGEFRNLKAPESEVRPLERNRPAAEGETGTQREQLAPLDEKGTVEGSGAAEKSDDEMRKRPIRRSEEGSPPLMNSDKGIIEN